MLIGMPGHFRFDVDGIEKKTTYGFISTTAVYT
jgi:hypothetical protein